LLECTAHAPNISADFGCQQFALTASPAELKDPFSVGVVNGTGVIEGADLRNFLRDKLRRSFVKKGVRIRFQNNHSLRILTHVAPPNSKKCCYPSECLSRAGLLAAEDCVDAGLCP
jgi:hypothetical protein